MAINTASKALTALQTQVVKVTCTLRDDLTRDDYGDVTLTIRTDPLYPRNRAQIESLPLVNPYEWPLVESFVGEWVDDDASDIVIFEVTLPNAPGKNRYVLDVVADGGVAGRVELVPVTWVDVNPTLK